MLETQFSVVEAQVNTGELDPDAGLVVAVNQGQIEDRIGPVVVLPTVFTKAAGVVEDEIGADADFALWCDKGLDGRIDVRFIVCGKGMLYDQD